MTKLEPIKQHEENINFVEDKIFEEERSLYGLKDAIVKNVQFKGKKDGESPLKESSSVTVMDSFFDLRYPIWNSKEIKIINSKFSENCRASIWYTHDIEITGTSFLGVKSFRECSDILLSEVEIKGDEPIWKVKDLSLYNSKVEGHYAFFQNKNLKLSKLSLLGKYSFQYCKNIKILNSDLDTKDAFWHTKNMVVKDSKIKGEYIGWFSKNLTFINCVIESHQPFCYAKNIKFVDCKLVNTDLAFEYSTVKGNILGSIDSIKNPKRLKLHVDEVKEIVKENSKIKVRCKILAPKIKK